MLEAYASTDIEAIVASGSAVRDVERIDDLDLIVVYRAFYPDLPAPPIMVDLRKYKRSDVIDHLEAGHEYLLWTLRYGRVLFERQGWWTRLRKEWVGRIPLPSVEVARERAQAAQGLRDEMTENGDATAAAELHLSSLTHLARAALSSASVFPQSRPELPRQLRSIGQLLLAEKLSNALASRYVYHP